MATFKNIHFHELPVHWSLKNNEPQLYEQIVNLIPSIAKAEQIHNLPAQKRALITTESELIVRPHRHWRAFYFKLSQLNPDCKGYLALKGSEALAENINELLENIKPVHSVFSSSFRKSGLGLHNSIHALLPMADRFLFVENKVPLLYLLSEAVDEVQSAIDLQKVYLDSYKTLAKIPIPLGIYQIPEEQLDKVCSLFEAFYEAKRYKQIQKLMSEGLAIQTYWYPEVPHRVAHIDAPSAVSKTSFKERIQKLSTLMDSEQCVEHWLLQFSRFLNLGYVPTDPVHALTGYCIDPGNLVLDGGMVDLASMRHLDSFDSPAQAQFVFENAISFFAQSIMVLLVGKDANYNGFMTVFPDIKQIIYAYIYKNSIIDEEMNRFVHPLIKNWVNPKPSYNGLIEKLTDFFEL